MGGFEAFLIDDWRKRLESHRLLVVFDPTRRFEPVARALACDTVDILTADRPPLELREQALEHWRSLCADSQHARHLVIHLRQPRPTETRDLLADPFTALVLAGAAFPRGAGDSFLALAQKYLPERAGEIEDLFRDQEPDFEVINSLKTPGAQAPILGGLFHAGSSREILTAFLNLDQDQVDKLQSTPGWRSELSKLLHTVLGLKLATKGVDPADLARQIWRYLLFSEFVADLPGPLPPSLESVPHASRTHQNFIDDLCEALRDSRKTRDAYQSISEDVAVELNLEETFRQVRDLGVRDTFSFEERSFLHHFAEAALKGNLESAADIADQRKESFWAGSGTRALDWALARISLRLLERLSLHRERLKELAKAGLKDLAEYYASEYSTVDRAHREMEFTVLDLSGEDSPLHALVTEARENYRKVTEELIRQWQARVVVEGWPISGLARSGDVFSRHVHDRWKEKERVAFFMVDALRLDLARHLEESLPKAFKSKLNLVTSQLPSVTRVGMASLLPEAGTKLKLAIHKKNLVPTLEENRIENPEDRFARIQAYLGENRTRMVKLEDLISPGGRKKMDLEDIEVLVVRSTEIDLFGETEALKAMKALPDILRELGIALRKVAEYGFNRAVIATDHGFLWIPDPSQGHAVKVPTGTWPYGKTRSLLGEGSAGEGVEVMDCSQLAIPIDQPKFAFARGLATFKKGVSFFHDGVSPHENIIPVLDIRLTTEPAKTAKSSKLEVTLTYRGKSEGTITTRRPAIEVSIPQPDLLSPQEIRFRLVAMDDKKKVVGEPTASQHVDPATRTVRIMPGQAFKVALKMDETFQGFFTVRAEDPETSQTLATINLSTDYHD